MKIGSKEGWIDAYFPQPAYGFIHSLEAGNLRRWFFHVSGIVSGVPKVGSSVTFDIDIARIIPGKSVLPVNNVAITPQHGTNDSAQVAENPVELLLSGKEIL